MRIRTLLLIAAVTIFVYAQLVHGAINIAKDSQAGTNYCNHISDC